MFLTLSFFDHHFAFCNEHFFSQEKIFLANAQCFCGDSEVVSSSVKRNVEESACETTGFCIAPWTFLKSFVWHDLHLIVGLTLSVYHCQTCETTFLFFYVDVAATSLFKRSLVK